MFVEDCWLQYIYNICYLGVVSNYPTTYRTAHSYCVVELTRVLVKWQRPTESFKSFSWSVKLNFTVALLQNEEVGPELIYMTRIIETQTHVLIVHATFPKYVYTNYARRRLQEQKKT